MIENLSFTDPQGRDYTAAVVRTRNAHYRRSTDTHENIQLTMDMEDLSKAADVVNSDRSNEDIRISVDYVYWPDRTSYDNNGVPYPLMNFNVVNNASLSFNINKEELKKDKYTLLSLEEKCELYFQDELLPQLQQGAA